MTTFRGEAGEEDAGASDEPDYDATAKYGDLLLGLTDAEAYERQADAEPEDIAWHVRREEDELELAFIGYEDGPILLEGRRWGETAGIVYVSTVIEAETQFRVVTSEGDVIGPLAKAEAEGER